MPSMLSGYCVAMETIVENVLTLIYYTYYHVIEQTMFGIINQRRTRRRWSIGSILLLTGFMIHISFHLITLIIT